jgi:hypothetical protein
MMGKVGVKAAIAAAMVAPRLLVNVGIQQAIQAAQAQRAQTRSVKVISPGTPPV